MDSSNKPITCTLVVAVILTAAYFVILMQLPQYSIARGNFGTWGFAGYLVLISLLGFVLTAKSSVKTAVFCSTVIPILFAAVIILWPHPLRIPVFYQNGENNGSIPLGLGVILALTLHGGGVLLAVSAALCGLRDDKRQGQNGRIKCIPSDSSQ